MDDGVMSWMGRHALIMARRLISYIGTYCAIGASCGSGSGSGLPVVGSSLLPTRCSQFCGRRQPECSGKRAAARLLGVWDKPLTYRESVPIEIVGSRQSSQCV